jgi:mono/diheme cytochrome c family protein
MKKMIGWLIGAAGLVAVAVFVFLVVFEDPHIAQGRATYKKYCSGCHGVKGHGNGFNADYLDPYPRDLTDSVEPYMAEGTDEEIFSAIASGVAGFAPPMEGIQKHIHDHGDGEVRDEKDGHEMEMGGGDMHGEAVSEGQEHEMNMNMDETGGSPLMPYWGFTLSDLQMWELVAYIRTLHKNDQPPVDFEQGFEAKRRKPSLSQELHLPSGDSPKGRWLISKGKRLFENRYACQACHELKGEGGKIGPPLDRAGVRLNPEWVYQWIQDPLSVKRDTTMPAFGLSDREAKAITLYLTTLQTGPQ